MTPFDGTPSPTARALVRALIVEDEPVSRRLVSSLLRAEGIHVDEATDGAHALLAVAATRYDVILLDLTLGDGPSGLEVLRTLREDLRNASTPVIVVSGSAGGAEAIARGLEHGADDYLIKPAQPVELLARVRNACRKASHLRALNQRATSLQRHVEQRDASLAAAARTQRAILSALPFRAGQVAAAGEVVASDAVSGDVIDVVRGADGTVTAFLIDVAGHGPPAAMLASSLRATLREVALGAGTMQEIVAAAERFLTTSRGAQVVSVAAVGLIRIASNGHDAEVLNAGLPPIAYLDATGTTQWVASSMPPLGMPRRRAPLPTEVAFGAGGLFAIASDGATGNELDEEAMSALLMRAGANRLGAWLSQARTRDLEVLLREHLGLHPDESPTDDATLLFVGHLEVHT